jgi:hypothetical protein
MFAKFCEVDRVALLKLKKGRIEAVRLKEK